MSDNQRIQVDVRMLPAGVKPKLIEMAAEAGVSLTDYIRTILCERALGGNRIQELHDVLATIVEHPEYVPLV